MSQAPQEEAPKLDHACPRWLKDYLEDLRMFCTRIQPIAGLGTSVSQAPKGRAINATGSEGETTLEPVNFQLINASSGGTNRVRVRQGVVKAGGTSWIPSGMSPGDSEPYILTVGATGYIVLIVTVDADGITNSVTIGSYTVVPADTDTNGHLVLGTYGASAGVFSVTGAVGDQAYIHAGGEHHFWSVQA